MQQLDSNFEVPRGSIVTEHLPDHDRTGTVRFGKLSALSWVPNNPGVPRTSMFCQGCWKVVKDVIEGKEVLTLTRIAPDPRHIPSGNKPEADSYKIELYS